ncbi:MAG: hypothetical protein J6A20_10950 [Muribaculaceae bacterium]|nr:hypothetical protein [Muribaculaceae bacterium]
MKLLFWQMKVCHSNFVYKPIKIHMKMKKFLSLILMVIAIVTPSIAQEPKENSSSTTIKLEFQQTTEAPTLHRAPMRINIEAYYDSESHTINIYYDGEASGEVFFYLNETIIEYDSQINTSFQISTPGLYKIEIIGETWIAEGYIQSPA